MARFLNCAALYFNFHGGFHLKTSCNMKLLLLQSQLTIVKLQSVLQARKSDRLVSMKVTVKYSVEIQ
jgi:hypothetical protein